LSDSVYHWTPALPAKIAPSRPTTSTTNFFIATTPNSDSAKAAQRTSLGGPTLPFPSPGVNLSPGHPTALLGANERSLEIKLDGVRGGFGPRLDLELPVDIAQVRLDGALAETKPVGDGFVSLALDDHF
jgi:hypothetical protein